MKSRFIIPPEIDTLKREGYICLQIQPMRWRIRGELAFIDVWPLAKRFIRHPQQFLMYERKPHFEDFTDFLTLVHDTLKPWPSERTLDQQDAFGLWRCMMDEVLSRLSTSASLQEKQAAV